MRRQQLWLWKKQRHEANKKNNNMQTQIAEPHQHQHQHQELATTKQRHQTKGQTTSPQSQKQPPSIVPSKSNVNYRNVWKASTSVMERLDRILHELDLCSDRLDMYQEEADLLGQRIEQANDRASSHNLFTYTVNAPFRSFD